MVFTHRREGVHDDVHPENLHHRERHVGSEQRADEADIEIPINRANGRNGVWSAAYSSYTQ